MAGNKSSLKRRMQRCSQGFIRQNGNLNGNSKCRMPASGCHPAHYDQTICSLQSKTGICSPSARSPPKISDIKRPPAEMQNGLLSYTVLLLVLIHYFILRTNNLNLIYTEKISFSIKPLTVSGASVLELCPAPFIHSIGMPVFLCHALL